MQIPRITGCLFHLTAVEGAAYVAAGTGTPELSERRLKLVLDLSDGSLRRWCRIEQPHSPPLESSLYADPVLLWVAVAAFLSPPAIIWVLGDTYFIKPTLSNNFVPDVVHDHE